MKLTPDNIVAAGLVIALILSIVLGGDTTLQTNIAAGLTGYLGRTIVDKTAQPTQMTNGVTKGMTKEALAQ